MERDWSTALPDWEERIVAGRSLVPELPLFKEEAAWALRNFKRLKIPDVHGTPTMAKACGPWFFPIVAALFGSYDRELKKRMIQEYFLLVPKKNGKSSTAGAIMLTAMLVNERPEAEFVIIAPTIKIANHSFEQAAKTIQLDDVMRDSFKTTPHKRQIVRQKAYKDGKLAAPESTLTILAADTDIVTGGKQVGTLIDETHVFASKSRASAVFVELRGALAARPDGFLFQISTQSKEPPAGVFKSELETAREVRDGKVKKPLLPVIFEYPEALAAKDAWRDRRYWKIVNPNLGRSVSEDFLERELETAERKGAAELALFASQFFNVQIGVRLGSDRWRGAEHWEGAADTTLTLDELIARSEVAIVGIDGGGLDDLLGVAVLGREKGTRNWLLWGRGWCQAEVLTLRKEIAPALLGFEKDGDLVIIGRHQLADGTWVDGVGEDDPDPLTADIRGVADVVEKVFKADLLPAEGGVGFDPQGVGAMVDELARRGITAPCVVAVPQGFRLSSAVWSMERKLKDGTLIHAGQGLMNFCVGNAKVEQKGNAVLITKEAAGRAKIDLLIAAFDAAKLMERNPEAGAGRSVYSTRGVLVV